MVLAIGSLFWLTQTLETALLYAHTDMGKAEFITQWVGSAGGPGGKLDYLVCFYLY